MSGPARQFDSVDETQQPAATPGRLLTGTLPRGGQWSALDSDRRRRSAARLLLDVVTATRRSLCRRAGSRDLHASVASGRAAGGTERCLTVGDVPTAGEAATTTTTAAAVRRTPAAWSRRQAGARRSSAVCDVLYWQMWYSHRALSRPQTSSTRISHTHDLKFSAPEKMLYAIMSYLCFGSDSYAFVH